MKILILLSIILTTANYAFECKFKKGREPRLSNNINNDGVIPGTPDRYVLYTNEGEKHDPLWWNSNTTLAACVKDAITCKRITITKPVYKYEYAGISPDGIRETHLKEVSPGVYEIKIIAAYDSGSEEERTVEEYDSRVDGVSSCKAAKNKYVENYVSQQ